MRVKVKQTEMMMVKVKGQKRHSTFGYLGENN